MNDQQKTKPQLLEELAALRGQVAALERSLEEWSPDAAIVLKMAPLGIHECDTDGRITYVNPCQERITGYKAEELLGTSIWDRIEPGPQKDSLPAYLKNLVLNQPPITPYVVRNIRKNGEVYDLRVDWDYKRNPEGQVTGFVCIITDVTAQQQAEAALRESEQRYRQLTESTTDMIYIADRTGRILYANTSAAAAMRCDAHSIVGKRQEELFPPEIARRHIRNVVRVFETGESFDVDGVYRFGSEELWLNTSLMPLRNEKGQITSVMGVSRDITARKRAEDALQQAHDELERRVEERTADLTKANEELAVFRRFVEASGEGLGMASLDGHVIYVNPAMCRLLAEKGPEDVVGKHLSDYFSEEYLLRRETEIIPHILREGCWRGENVITRQGESTTVLQDSFLVRNNDGDPVYLSTVFTDITAHKQAEEALRQSQQKYKALVEASPDAVLMTDLKQNIIFASQQSAELFGYDSVDELCQQPATVLVAEEDRQRLAANIPLLIQQGKRRQTEYVGVRRDGTRFAGEVSSALLHDDTGQPWAFMAVARDITARKQAEEALRQQHRTLQHLLQSSDHERQLIAYEIHDGLAQQLAGAIMQLETYFHQKDAKPKEAAKAFEAAMTMLRQGHFEARRLISGVRPSILDESGVVAAIAHLVSDQSLTGRVKVEFHSKVDFDRLAPILENSIYRIAQEGLANACRHSKSDKVKVGLVQRGDGVRIEIHDWGIGFDPKNVREGCYGLTGIRQRTKLLGGKCSIRSRLGKGTRVAVELPVVARE